ncbi:MAG: hypothetical protein KR126chlam3_01221 [Chlamydiae bacterium]|nr:hypothetical protein [Chlamydiota bacterium]
MAVERLSIFSESYLKDLNLSNREFEQVKYSIIKYSAPNSFMNFLKYVAFRVWNAVKSLFGYSAWQQSVWIVKNTLFNKIRPLVNEATIGEDIRAQILMRSLRVSREISDMFLQYCLSVNEKKVDIVPEDRFNIVKRFEETIQELCTKYRNIEPAEKQA